MDDGLSSSASSTSSLAEMDEDPRVLCGRRPSKEVLRELKERLEVISPIGLNYMGRAEPCLAVVLVGERKDSRLYVKIKKRVAAKLGIKVRVLELDEASTTPDKLRSMIRALNADDSVDGVLVQVPLPSHLPVSICQAIAPDKDVDGFNFTNMGKLALNGIMVPDFSPCTPRGVLELLDYHQVDVAGKHVVILGRSTVVGLPLSLMLLAQNATVTICHSKTPNLKMHTNQADILICAMGQPRLVDSSWIRAQGVCIVDVGVSVLPKDSSLSSSDLKSNSIVGDVDFASLMRDTDARVTPVPVGVGPMTVAMLMKASVEAFERRCYEAEILDGDH